MGKHLGQLTRVGASLLVASMLLSSCGSGKPAGQDQTANSGTGTQDTTKPATGPVTLSFDGGSTGGGGGKANTAAVDYCYVISGGAMFELNRLVDSRLIAFSPDLSTFVPELAETYDVKGNTVTFHLRKNAKWHDGKPLTAKDVLFTFNTLANKDSGSRYTVNFTKVKGFAALASGSASALAGLTAPDDSTVNVEFSAPDSGFLPILPFLPIMPEHILGEVPKNKICEASFWTENRIGSGPYKWGKRLDGQRIELEANPDYFLGKPKIDKINHLVFASFETSLAAFEQQASMVAPMTASNLDYVKKMDFAKIETTPAGVGSIFINTKLSEFADKRVRQAISYAIDRKTITENIFMGTAKPAWSELPWLDWVQAPDLNHYDYNPDKAKALLKDAGFKSDKTFTMWYYYPDEVTAAAMEAIQQYLGAVGIKVKPQRDEGGAMSKSQRDGTWQLIYGSYGAQPDPSALGVIWSCAQEKTWSYCNKQFDDNLDKALSTLDRNQQKIYYTQAVKILNEDLPWVWLFDRKNLIAVNKKLDTGSKGAWGPGHLGYHNYAETWTLKQ